MNAVGLEIPRRFKRMVLARHPAGLPQDEDFRIEEVESPGLADGEVGVQVTHLGIEPRLRLILNPTRPWNAGMRPLGAMSGLGRVIPGSTLGVVTASRRAGYAPGDLVEGMLGWQQFAVTAGLPHETNNPEGLRVCDRSQGTRIEDHIGALGVPGLTAFLALRHEGRLKPGETVVVNSAAGMVGSLAGQLARLAGARVVGLTSTAEKLEYLRTEAGFDVAISYRDRDWAAQLAQHVPNGIDYFFDNVGGDQAKAILALCNPGARVTRCGIVSKYTADEWNQTEEFKGQFSVHQHVPEYAAARSEISSLLKGGDLKYRITVVPGLAAAPGALRSVLEGRNIGRWLVRVDV